MTPYKMITGSAEWLEERIVNFKFQGVGWYAHGTILVVAYGALFQAYLYHHDPRAEITESLALPVHE